MTHHLFPAILIGILAVPALAGAQHTAGGAPSVGTAVSSAPAPAPSGGGSSSSSGGGGSTAGSSSSTSGDVGRRRGDLPVTGTAVIRSGHGGPGGGAIIGGGGFYPWGYPYDGVIDAYYSGYYGAYDPWYGWYPTFAPGYGDDYLGSLRLRVKPVEASVYVDGFYVGVVDDFDGAFQRLRLDRGPHHIEMRRLNYQPLSVDVIIQEDFTITYRGELAKQ